MSRPRRATEIHRWPAAVSFDDSDLGPGRPGDRSLRTDRSRPPQRSRGSTAPGPDHRTAPETMRRINPHSLHTIQIIACRHRYPSSSQDIRDSGGLLIRPSNRQTLLDLLDTMRSIGLMRLVTIGANFCSARSITSQTRPCPPIQLIDMLRSPRTLGGAA